MLGFLGGKMIFWHFSGTTESRKYLKCLETDEEGFFSGGGFLFFFFACFVQVLLLFLTE